MRRVGDSLTAEQDLGAEHLKVVLDLCDLCLIMEMRDVCITMAAGRNTKGAILDTLDAVEGGLAEVRRPDGSGVVYCRLDVRFINLQHDFLLAAPSSASQGIHNSEFSSAFLDDLRGVRIEVKIIIIIIIIIILA